MKTERDFYWRLTPKDAFPVTIRGVDKITAISLKALLDGAMVVHPTSMYEYVAELIAKTALRCKEVEDYVAEYREIWASGREPDVCPYCDLDALFAGDRLGAGGTELVAKYGFSNLRFYCRQSENARPVSKEHRDRWRWEALLKSALATLGPPMTKRGKTGEAFSTVPLNISKDNLASWIAFCTAVAEIVTLTYVHSVFSAKRRAKLQTLDEILKGYKVVGVGDDCMCSYCSRMDGRKYAVGKEPRPPFHIGCRCSLIMLFST